MPISLVVAIADNGVIGREGGLPWHLSADLRHFKSLTMGHAIIMGRRTHESIGKPLPGRTNIVITRDPDYATDGVTVVHSLDEAVAKAMAKSDLDEAMIIGGAQIYRMALDRAARIYLTEVHMEADGETRFPAFDRAAWQESAREDFAGVGDAPAYSFVTLERI